MKPLVQIGFMPKALSTQAGAVSAQLGAGIQLQPHLHRLGLSADRLREVGRAGLPVGSPRGAAIRRERSQDLVLGSVERAGHRLLAGYAGGIPEAVRLRR